MSLTFYYTSILVKFIILKIQLNCVQNALNCWDLPFKKYTMEDNIKEGFICPICRKELDSLAGLQGHFENAHSSEDKAGLRAVKGLFGRAKRKLLGDLASSNNETVVGDSEEVSRLRSGSEASGIDPVLWEPQEFGKQLLALASNQAG